MKWSFHHNGGDNMNKQLLKQLTIWLAEENRFGEIQKCKRIAKVIERNGGELDYQYLKKDVESYKDSRVPTPSVLNILIKW